MKGNVVEFLDKIGLKQTVKNVAIAVGLHETKEHGHELMVAEINRLAAQGLDLTGRTLVEIGTTREDVPGLGSTSILANLCHLHGIQMITVDMDSDNTQCAKQEIQGLGKSFTPVTQKGEEFLQAFERPIDFIYLDAFDFEHPNHSAKRKKKYEALLGTTINNSACHKMHLDCAYEIVRLARPGTIVVFDDVWREAGVWRGKGETAIPHLVSHGFEVTSIGKNSATLVLKR
ncbi:hypothetical protein [Salibaculum halophilum]|uniref:hypothetical protein n=1 Tax=Salibaculum halophilum TaxID=1914408 RepID=UPI00117A8249|nr:hypothetical protein [Salibaculum halophilum]